MHESHGLLIYTYCQHIAIWRRNWQPGMQALISIISKWPNIRQLLGLANASVFHQSSCCWQSCSWENLQRPNIRLQRSASSHGPSPASTHVDARNTLIRHLDNVHSEHPRSFKPVMNKLTGKKQHETTEELEVHWNCFQNYKCIDSESFPQAFEAQNRQTLLIKTI